MKYWLLTTEFPPLSGGGIGTYCYQWSKLLLEKKADVTVFLMNKSVNSIRETNLEGIRVIEFPAYLTDTSSFLGFETSIAVSFEKITRQFIEKEGKPDFIESQEYNGIAYFILQRKHLGYPEYKDVPIVINCHCPSFIAFEYNLVNTSQLPYFWIGEMERFCLKAADCCISPSQYLVEILLKKHPSLNREYKVLKNPFNINQVPQTDFQQSGQAVFFGKLSPIKGILELLKAFSELWNEGSEYRLVLVGDEYYYYHGIGNFMGKHIRQQFAKYIQKGFLQIKGAISQDKLGEMAQSARFIVIPSSFDNFPYAVLEMMARRKLVLASDSGGHREILVHENNGLLYRGGDITDFKSKITRAFSMTPEESLVMGENAFRSVKQQCDPETYFKEKIKLLQELKPADNAVFPFVNVKAEIWQINSSAREKPGLLSVVVPFYNMEKYIDHTIASIKDSTYKDIEIIIVNDGSNQPESQISLEKLKGQENIMVISQNNKGLPEARNTGSAHATGEFLSFLDSDDLVKPDYYKKAIDILQNKTNVHFVGCWTKYFEGSENSWPAFTPEPPYLLFHNMVNSSSLVYRRSSYLKSGGNDKRFLFGMEDYDSVISMVEKGLAGIAIPEELFLYRVRKDSMSRGFNKSNVAYTHQLLTEKHKQFYANFGAEIADILNANGPGFNYENPTLDYHLYSAKSIKNYLVRNLVKRIKRQPVLRRIAINFYRRLKLLLL